MIDRIECDKCNGTGVFLGRNKKLKCTPCQGDGFIDLLRLEFLIPYWKARVEKKEGSRYQQAIAECKLKKFTGYKARLEGDEPDTPPPPPADIPNLSEVLGIKTNAHLLTVKFALQTQGIRLFIGPDKNNVSEVEIRL